MLNNTPLVWAEIAVNDMNRAIEFYQTHLGLTFTREVINDMEMAVINKASQDDAGVALIKHQMMKPSMDGSTIYLHLSDNLSPLLAKLKQQGVIIIMDAIPIHDGECGYSATFADSEGNKVGLWSKNL